MAVATAEYIELLALWPSPVLHVPAPQYAVQFVDSYIREAARLHFHVPIPIITSHLQI